MQRYFSNEKIESQFILNDDDIHHIKNVMRGKENDQIEIVYNNELYIAKIKTNGVNIELIESHKADWNKRNNQQITLIIPLLKEQKMDYILQKATELNVTHIIPIKLNRCVVKIDAKKEENKIQRWQKICKEAAEQSKQLHIPVISNIKTIKDILTLEGTNLICSTVEKNKKLHTVIENNIQTNINFIFGPEGGIEPGEEKLLIESNFIPITFGNSILRSETAPLYLLSIINYEREKIAD